VRKEPGCSVVEVHGEVHEFFVRDKSHPRYGEIKSVCGEINKRLTLAGYRVNANEVLFDIEEEERGCNKLAQQEACNCFWITLNEGVDMRIVKNLRGLLGLP
jgi:DYW family of nucleic acid deaminases